MLDSVPPEKRLDYFDQKINHKCQVKLRTCADVYNYWRNCKRLYKKAPKDGLEFQIDYIDTGLALNEDIRSNAPIALALHGAPGSYHDFALLIHHLTQQNVRVIAPNFPEYVATVKTKVLFRHSADEKAAYLRDFLKAIKINKIDLLVSHSSAIFPTLLMLLNANQRAIAKQKELNVQQQQQQQQQRSKKQLRELKKLNGKSQQHTCNILIKDVNTLAAANERGCANAYSDASDNAEDGCTSECSAEIVGDLCPGEDEADKFVDAKDVIDSNNNSNETGVSKRTTNPEESDALRFNKQQQDNYDNECDPKRKSYQLNSRRGKVGDEEKEKEEEEEEEEEGKGGGEEEGAEEAEGVVDHYKDCDCADGKRTTQRKRHRSRHHNDRKRNQDPIVQFDQPIEIKAVALFNPAGHRLPKSMKPTWFKCGSVHIYQHKLGRSLFRKLGPAFLTVVGVPVRVDNMDNVMLSATVMRNSKCQRVVQQLEQLSQMQIPTLLVFSENDKLIEKEIFYEMTQFMKLDSKNFDIFNDEGEVEKSQSRVDDWIRVMVFKAGGHYAYSNYAKTVNKAVSELLMKVVN